jgi:hypothetical protein
MSVIGGFPLGEVGDFVAYQKIWHGFYFLLDVFDFPRVGLHNILVGAKSHADIYRNLQSSETLNRATPKK